MVVTVLTSIIMTVFVCRSPMTLGDDSNDDNDMSANVW